MVSPVFFRGAGRGVVRDREPEERRYSVHGDPGDGWTTVAVAQIIYDLPRM
ncbi:hypothetical protein KVA01_15980 [Kocuria varians]|uniref:Uncharacterized protein n=1 Tax=Kocuria varians TaxID=1272 RepID=A0A4Y4D763_KOCVA|nr:hypothetical protein KVA01_15980 [Kocuria varians]